MNNRRAEKGVRSNLPIRPGGCCAQIGPDPFFRSNRGLSLLEVILAIAILAGCIAAVAELMRVGSYQAEEARELTIGQLLCESKIAEIASGVVPPEAATSAAFENDPRWLYSIAITQLDDQSLLGVQVTVQQAEPTRELPLTFSLTCWMIDPSLALMEEEMLEPTVDDEMMSSGGTDAL